jgi:hypothetical protein
MTRLAALALMALVAALPLTVLPSPYLGWLAVPAVLVGGAGALALVPPLTTAGAAIALIEYALALLIARPAPDLITATGFGAALVLLLTLVHSASRLHGAWVSRAVVWSEGRQWLLAIAVGSLAAMGLTIVATALRLALPDAAAAAVVAAALGALVTVGGVIALLTPEDGVSNATQAR